MRKLVADGWLERRLAHSRPELALSSELVAWAPGDEPPDVYRLESKLRVRWKDPVTPTVIFLATKKAANLFGGKAPGLKRAVQVTHDLHMGTIYLCYTLHRPEEAKLWRGEELIAAERRHQKLPDAVIYDRLLGPIKLIEFAGAYRQEHLQAFHDDAKRRHIPYEIW
jgi:hypothetical protein